MAVDFGQFYQACPGVVLTREIEAVLAGLAPGSSAAAIAAAVTPLMPDGNVPQYTRTAPVEPPAPMPNSSPVYTAALPAQPNVLIPVDGGDLVPGSNWGNAATFAQGLRRFADSNPDPLDNWSIEAVLDDASQGPGG